MTTMRGGAHRGSPWTGPAACRESETGTADLEHQIGMAGAEAAAQGGDLRLAKTAEHP